jgi:hypothetical protein
MAIQRGRGYEGMSVRQLRAAQKRAKSDLEYETLEQFILKKQGKAPADRSLAAARRQRHSRRRAAPAPVPRPEAAPPVRLSKREAAAQLAELQRRRDGARTDLEYWSYQAQYEQLKKSQQR